jgi:epoxyqueuosine reductase
VPFVSRDFAKRTDPAKSLKNANLIIVIGVPYEKNKTVGFQPTPDPLFEKSGAKTLTLGNLSSLGTNADYHKRAKVLLRELAEELGELGEFKHKILVDSPALDERAIAHRAGLGFFGKNGLLISPKFGSRFNIGCLVISTHDKVLMKLFQKFLGGSGGEAPTVCNPSCDLCLKACPTGALGGGALDSERCISYLTQKDDLSPEEEKMLAGQLYGCDICQNCCPFNTPAQAAAINPSDWLSLSDNDFREKYGHTAMLWRGAEILRRNASL